MNLTEISRFSKTLVSRETMPSVKGGADKVTVVYDWCTLSAGDNREDGDDPSFYNDPD